MRDQRARARAIVLTWPWLEDQREVSIEHGSAGARCRVWSEVRQINRCSRERDAHDYHARTNVEIITGKLHYFTIQLLTYFV